MEKIGNVSSYWRRNSIWTLQTIWRDVTRLWSVCNMSTLNWNLVEIRRILQQNMKHDGPQRELSIIYTHWSKLSIHKFSEVDGTLKSFSEIYLEIFKWEIKKLFRINIHGKKRTKELFSFAAHISLIDLWESSLCCLCIDSSIRSFNEQIMEMKSITRDLLEVDTIKKWR